MKSSFILILFLTTALGFSQQEGSLKGTVLDVELQNEPLLFANVQLKGAGLKTETNFHGNFEFNNLDKGDYILVVSYVGYENIEMPVTITADQVAQVNLGMSAKQISFDNVVGLETASEEKEVLSIQEELPKE